MSVIKKFFTTLTEHFRRTMAAYPVTMALVVLVSLSVSVFIDQRGPFAEFMEDRGIQFLLLWGVGTYFAETYWREKKTLKWGGIIAAGLIAAGLIRFGEDPSETVRELADRRKTAYVIILTALSVYRNFRNSGLPFNQYCIRVVHELSRLAIVCGITALGIGLVTATFVALILNGSDYMLILRAEFLVLGCIFGSGLLDAQIRLDRELPRFFIVIVKYLLMILLMAAFAIIYGYILKIIITRDVPSNEIFRILAGLFILGMPIWTLAGSFEDDTRPVRIAGILPYVFIPFLFLQGYAIRVRILGFGLTPLRYLCIAMMVFEIIYIIVYALRKRETGIMLPILAVMTLICLVIPGVNMYTVSNRSQKAIFDRYITSEFSDLTYEEQTDLTGAYYYLNDSEEGKAMIANADPAKIEAIKAAGRTGRSNDDRFYFYYDFPLLGEDISGYSSMTEVLSKESERNDDKTYDPGSVSFIDDNGRTVLTADLSDFIDRCIAEYKANPGNTPAGIAAVSLPNGDLLRITYCRMIVRKSDHAITTLSIEGILLER